MCGAVCKSHQCSGCFSVFMQQKCDFEANFCLILTPIAPNSSLSCLVLIAHSHTLSHTLTHSHTLSHTLTLRETVDVHQKSTVLTKIELPKLVYGQFFGDWVYSDSNTCSFCPRTLSRCPYRRLLNARPQAAGTSWDTHTHTQ